VDGIISPKVSLVKSFFKKNKKICITEVAVGIIHKKYNNHSMKS